MTLLKQFTLFAIAVMGANEIYAQALDAPVLNCLQVNLAGNPTAIWDAPLDPNGQFVSYQVWHGQDFGTTFASVGTVNNIATTSFQHNITSPLATNECYYIVAESSDGVNTWFSEPSDTICTISLDALPSVSPVGFINLTWTSPYPFGAPAGTTYELLMEYPAGVWNTIQSLPFGTNSYSFEVAICQADLNFLVQVNTPAGCAIISDLEGGTFSDQTPPDIPEVTSVSVDHTTNDAVINWNPSPSPDTQGYILYKCNGATVTAVDSIFGANNTQFIDILANTTTGPVCYLLAAFDTCYTGIPPSPNTSPTGDVCNCSVFLDPIPYAVCDHFVEMTWSPYSGWANGVDYYNIYHSFGGSLPELIGTVNGSITTFTHTFDTIETGVHSYYIEAISVGAGNVSISNLRNVTIVYPSPPLWNYLSSASVTGQEEITISIETEAVGTEHQFILQRFRPSNGEWDDVNQWANLGGTNVQLSDVNVTPPVFSYTYRVIVQNICGTYVDTTNIGTTMVLEGMASSPRMVNILQWSPYMGWENNVDSYRIHRKIGKDGPDEVIAEISSGVLFYEDDVSDLIFTEGDFCYLIEAIENPSSLFPFNAFSSFSNELCLTQEPKIWVPNAFVVDGYNSTFFPVISFANFNAYKMIIYSRWGDIIFETADINEPWDGFMNGKLVQEGAYAYFISVEDGNGRPFEARGSVIMLSLRDQ